MDKCENCNSTDLLEYEGILELEHESTGIQAEVEIKGYECQSCGEISLSEEEAQRVIKYLDDLTKKEEQIDIEMYR